MTIERPARKPPLDGRLRNLRLHVATVLAGTYLFAWWVFAGRTPTVAETPPSARGGEAAPARAARVSWYGELAPQARPAVHAPPGWRLATGEPSLVAPPRQEPVASVRRAPGRIRTRSS